MELLSSLLSSFPQRFGRFVLWPSSGVCRTRKPTRNFELPPLLNPQGSPVLIPLTITALGFRIQIASNFKIVDFLDVTLNLNNGTFEPFSKNDSAPRYINISSNHPRSVLRQIPNAVNQRINKLSSGKKIFEENKSRYDDALKDSGFQGRLEYLTPVDLNSRARKNNGGTHTPIKVGEIINNSSHGNRGGKDRNSSIHHFVSSLTLTLVDTFYTY